MKRFNITVNGKAYDVAVEEVNGGAAPVPAAPVATAAPTPAAAPAAGYLPAAGPLYGSHHSAANSCYRPHS